MSPPWDGPGAQGPVNPGARGKLRQGVCGQSWPRERLALGSGNPVSIALHSPVATEWWPVCSNVAARAGRDSLALGLELGGIKPPCCAPEPSNTAWPILAVPNGGKSVTGSGLVTLFPKPYPSLHPPTPI